MWRRARSAVLTELGGRVAVAVEAAVSNLGAAVVHSAELERVASKELEASSVPSAWLCSGRGSTM